MKVSVFLVRPSHRTSYVLKKLKKFFYLVRNLMNLESCYCHFFCHTAVKS